VRLTACICLAVNRVVNGRTAGRAEMKGDLGAGPVTTVSRSQLQDAALMSVSVAAAAVVTSG
jgi:hypothetical protein